MTPEEIILEEAKKREKQSTYSNLAKSEKAHGVWSAYGVGFIDGAVFATETIIEKACEWIKNNTVTVINDVCTYTASSYDISKKEFVEDFKKAMEGGEQ